MRPKLDSEPSLGSRVRAPHGLVERLGFSCSPGTRGGSKMPHRHSRTARPSVAGPFAAEVGSYRGFRTREAVVGSTHLAATPTSPSSAADQISGAGGQERPSSSWTKAKPSCQLDTDLWQRCLARDQVDGTFRVIVQTRGATKREASDARAAIIRAWEQSDHRADPTFTLELFERSLRRLKPGKGSPDGVTAEMLRHLPQKARDAFGLDILSRSRELRFEASWAQCSATLAPKVPNAGALTQFRGIASLLTIRKVLGYMFLEALPQLQFQSVQTAFIAGAHACTGVHTLLRVAELAREWGAPVCAAQLDLKKAFDHVSHVAAFDAMDQQGVPLAAQALIAKLWDLTTVVGKLGREASQPVRLDRGVPQGAPESPVIFTMVVEMVLRKVMPRWQARGAGWKLDEVWVCCVCYADDIVLTAHSPRILEGMCADIIAEFRNIGLGVGAEKTHWTSMPPRPGEQLVVDGSRVEWESSLTYVGTVIDMTGSAGPAMTFRMVQAWRKLQKWKSILCAPWLPLRRRVDLTITAVWSSVLWCAQTWNPTQAQRAKLDSWSARVMARVLRLRKDLDEDIAGWWRRLHRAGHATLRRFSTSLSCDSRLLVHRWAGHIARMEPHIWPANLVHCRSLQWWRWRQERHTCKWTGVHPARFKASRWEAQLAVRYGDGKAESPEENTGWLAMTQDRTAWQQLGASF